MKKMEVGKELFTQALKEVGADENLASAESDSSFGINRYGNFEQEITAEEKYVSNVCLWHHAI